MRYYFYVFLLLFSILMSPCSLAGTKTKSHGIALDKIVVVLNNSVITQTELDEAMAKTKNQLAGSPTPSPSTDVLRKQVLDQLINRKLQLELAEQGNIHVTETDIDKAVNVIAARNHMSADELYTNVSNQGLQRSEYRQELHDEMTIQKLQQEAVASKITISPQEVDDFMRSAAWLAHNTREYHLEDILITLPENPSTQDISDAKKRADGLLTKLHQGMGFHEAAASESGDSSNALQGGDLGWRKLPEIPSAFANPLIQAKSDDIIGPIQTANGFHIVHVAGIRKATDVPGTTAQSKHQLVQQLLFQRKFEEALQSWLTKIRGEAFIDLHPDA
jgi:peptidyl-prolyl cis-trans isomerase SurA